MTLKDKIVLSLMNKIVERINSSAKLTINDVLDSYGATGRTMCISITDIGDGVTLKVEDGAMSLDDFDESFTPTCIVAMNKNTFAAILTNKLSHSDAFLRGALQIVGDNWLRDSVILGKIFDEMKDIMLPSKTSKKKTTKKSTSKCACE